MAKKQNLILRTPKNQEISTAIAAQSFRNGEIHDWYRIVLGYSDHLVAKLLKDLKIKPGQKVLDPFCGSGTTLVECLKLGIESVGIDANPSSWFAASVKTTWNLDIQILIKLLPQIESAYRKLMKQPTTLKKDKTFRYISSSGMSDRGWVSARPLQKSIALKIAISRLRTPKRYKDLLLLALMTELVKTASNMRFGPEIYCSKRKKDAPLLKHFDRRVRQMASEITIAKNLPPCTAKVILGDSRNCASLLRKQGIRKVDAILCSPPYPTEHDYTRNARLELALIESVFDKESLQTIKRGMMRSHTKGIYKEDTDSDLMLEQPDLMALVIKIDRKAKTKKHGFARLYSKVLNEYFGGMKRHLSSVYRVLTPGSPCAYVVGDQSSYFRVHIPTADILADIAADCGFVRIKVKHWRQRWSSTTSRMINENILIAWKPSA